MVRRRCSAGVGVEIVAPPLCHLTSHELTETDALFVCCCLVVSAAAAAEGDADGGPRDPGRPAVGEEPLVVDAHRAPPRPRGGLPPDRAFQQAASGFLHRPPRDVDADDDDDGGDDASPVGGLGLLQAEGHEARQGDGPAAAEPRGEHEHPRRREPDELPGVRRRRRAQLHDADAVGLRQGAGAGAAAAAAAAATAEGGPREAQVLLRPRPEHRELGQEPVLEGAVVVAGGHAGGVGRRRRAAPAVDQRAQRGLHRVHAGRARQETLQVDTCRVDSRARWWHPCSSPSSLNLGFVRDWWCDLVWVSNAFGDLLFFAVLCSTTSGCWLLCLEPVPVF